MKLVIFSLVILFSMISNAKIDLSEIKACLAGLYTAEKAYHYEKNSYSSNLHEIGFNYEACPDIDEYIFDVIEKDKFLISVKSKSGVIGSVNSQKEIHLH